MVKTKRTKKQISISQEITESKSYRGILHEQKDSFLFSNQCFEIYTLATAFIIRLSSAFFEQFSIYLGTSLPLAIIRI